MYLVPHQCDKCFASQEMNLIRNCIAVYYTKLTHTPCMYMCMHTATFLHLLGEFFCCAYKNDLPLLWDEWSELKPNTSLSLCASMTRIKSSALNQREPWICARKNAKEQKNTICSVMTKTHDSLQYSALQ